MHITCNGLSDDEEVDVLDKFETGIGVVQQRTVFRLNTVPTAGVSTTTDDAALTA